MIKAALIGTGNIAQQHIRGFLAYPRRCKIEVLADIYPESAEETKNRHGLDAEVYSDYRKVLDRSDIDLVDICGPPHTHAEISIAALDSGKHVLVEKPMAASLADCDAMLKAVKRSGRTLSVVAQNRFRPALMNLKTILDTGLAGDIVHVQVNSYWWRGHSYYDLWWRGTWEKEGGGCTLNHAVHHIDALIWMMGMPYDVLAVMGNTSHDNAEVEDLSMSFVRFENGALGQITASVVHHGEEQELIFQGKNARVSAPWKVCASSAKQNGFPVKNDDLQQRIKGYYATLPRIEFAVPHQGQINDVLQAIEDGKDPLIRGEDGKNTLELITAIYKSAITGEKVTLPLAKEDPFYTMEGILSRAPRFYKKSASVVKFDDNDITIGNI
ncbi:Gfo/Idh/MocA family oxidoreductase [Marispirochaeta sp.]|jgi:UDP-N-acetyl-2-amino-2-deoxyglucuronate dehydrogenase|uniref:Gfo/Idh/MocA family protein n=1 Tax=Marispirochaeta sp. TaxID=2038653 RepID=UPI0029C7C58E|nr:Gfo/Idh/MocA family oxidoreductase [Marispirochaeta sp.]